MIRFLPAEIVLAIHEDQIRLYGGSYGVRNPGMLDAALPMPQAQFDGEFLHTTLYSMAAAYGFHLCQNHPFIDGNKRAAGMAMLTFLQLNDLTPTVPEMEYYTVMMAVASGQMNKDELTNWVHSAVETL